MFDERTAPIRTNSQPEDREELKIKNEEQNKMTQRNLTGILEFQIEDRLQLQLHNLGLEIKRENGNNKITKPINVEILQGETRLVEFQASAPTNEGSVKWSYSNHIWKDLAGSMKEGDAHLLVRATDPVTGKTMQEGLTIDFTM